MDTATAISRPKTINGSLYVCHKRTRAHATQGNSLWIQGLSPTCLTRNPSDLWLIMVARPIWLLIIFFTKLSFTLYTSVGWDRVGGRVTVGGVWGTTPEWGPSNPLPPTGTLTQRYTTGEAKNSKWNGSHQFQFFWIIFIPRLKF